MHAGYTLESPGGPWEQGALPLPGTPCSVGGRRGGCFAYANELMASGGLAVTQQLWRGSPSRGSTEPRGLGSHGGT